MLPFPSPPPGVPPVGRFHALPSLQCRLHPAAVDGSASPDPAAVVDPTGGSGRTGWIMRANASDVGTFIPFAAGTCASPLEGVRGSPIVAPSRERRDVAVLSPLFSAAPPSDGGDGETDFAWPGVAFHAKAIQWAVARGPVGAAAKSEWVQPLHCADRPGRLGLVCEEEVTRLLTLQRNHWYGEVRRQHGIYDVAAVTRATFGVALDGKAAVVGAMDTVSEASGPHDGDRVAVVTYPTHDGRTRPVLVGEAALLSLGRGVLADPSWLGAVFPGRLSSQVSLIQAPRTARATWSLGHHDTPATNSSLWLQGMASALCWPPTTSFVVDESFCYGAEFEGPAGEATARSGQPYKRNYVGDSRGHFVGGAEVGVRWSVEPPDRPPSAPSCPAELDDLGEGLVPRQPIWLFGRGSRELHTTMPGGEAELTLATHLSSCTYERTRPGLLSRVHEAWVLGDITSKLSQRYDRDLFGKDPPPEPVSNVELVLAALVVMPEVAAVLLLLVQLSDTHPRPRALSWRQGLSCALVVLAGAGALVGICYLDRLEQAGHAWRAASVRVETRLPINRTEEEHMDREAFEYRGRTLTYTETLFLVARTGYRPAYTRRMLVGSAAVYAALTVAVIGWAVLQACLVPAHVAAMEDEDHDVENSVPNGQHWLSSSFMVPFAYLRKGVAPSTARGKVSDNSA